MAKNQMGKLEELFNSEKETVQDIKLFLGDDKTIAPGVILDKVIAASEAARNGDVPILKEFPNDIDPVDLGDWIEKLKPYVREDK
ncbi:hypothetical protein [Terasakiella sp. SH-1]|uniref:hypothetical protein n=1 Tax=Terasakiella sp. SH-1 TaxID=2560057 RepID=UPI001073B6CB|nr:hypothetical protein [Terasakiella sp. SH-1]